MFHTKQRAALGKLEKLRTGHAEAAQPAGQSRAQEALSPMPKPTDHLHCLGLAENLDAEKVKSGRKLGPNSHHYLLHMCKPCAVGCAPVFPLRPPGHAGDLGPGV